MPALRLSVEGSAAAGAVFGPQGGTVGRAVENTLVLRDAERSVSRLHARVECRDGRFVFINMGLNPAIHNGAVVATADEAPLVAGDVLRIGRFTLLVSEAGEHELPLQDEEARFDDMTGEPLPPRAPAWPDIALFDDSMAAALTDDGGGSDVQGVVAEVLRGMGSATPPLPAGITPEQAGQWMRRAIEDTLRTWIPHGSPAVHQAWFSHFDEALARISAAEQQVAQRDI
jgi:hypothetical protein